MIHAFAAATIVALALTMAAGYRKKWTAARIFKPIASAGFIAAALAGGALDSPYGQAVLVALVLSAFGDVFLMWTTRKLFLAGVVSFLLGHIGFSVAFVIHGVDASWTAAAVGAAVIISGVVLRWLLPHVDAGMRGPVLAYVAVISTMVALALGTQGAGGRPLILIAACGFYASDLAVARQRFVKRSVVNVAWGLPTYYGAQLAFAYTVV